MINDPKADLIDAILSLDSYNRGYGAGISQLGSTTQIGNWTILPDSENRPSIVGGQAAGFYAIAYQNATGEIVISYRGTDDNIGHTNTGGSDAQHGYGIALGAAPGTTFDLATDQAALAQAFYTAVTHKSDTEAAANVTLVGHSLGCGLAGFVNATTGTKAVVFDNLPYDVSATVEAAHLGVQAHFNTITGYYTEGEFLQAAFSWAAAVAAANDNLQTRHAA